MEIEFSLPKIKKGRKSKDDIARYDQELIEFAEGLKQLQLKIANKEQKDIVEKDKVSARGWCYLLEGMKLIDKSQFDLGQRIINHCRKEGYLPIDFVASDKARKFYHVEGIQIETKDYRVWVSNHLRWLRHIHRHKTDITFWENQEYYLQMMVEKIDVRNLFDDTCQYYHIPISNAKGWSDLLSRYSLALRFKEAEEIGLKPVLLYYGDFDPAGILIAEVLKKNLADIQKASGYNPKNLIVDHFGLTFDFIQKHNLLWIDNLKTGSKKDLSNPKHPDHNKAYVKDYIEKYGVRKCEANAILPLRDFAKQDCEEAIQKYLGLNSHEKYEKGLEKTKREIKAMLKTINFKNRIKDIMNEIEEFDLDQLDLKNGDQDIN